MAIDWQYQICNIREERRMKELVILVPMLVPLILIVYLLDGIQTDIRHLRWEIEEQTERKEHGTDRVDNQPRR